MKIERRPSTALLPVPAVLVTVTGEPRSNIITIAWAGTVCSAPPMLSIAVRPSRHSYPLLLRARDFVVNVPRAADVEKVDVCGIVSGRDENKWELTGFHPEEASKVSAPLIRECPINLECIVRHELSLGAHHLFLGEIVAVHYDEEILDSRGRYDSRKMDALAYVNGDYWSMGERVGTYGFAKKAGRGKH